jgi:uncharacterized protein YecT (DUF1311 family)
MKVTSAIFYVMLGMVTGVLDVHSDENDKENIRETARITGDSIEVVKNYYEMCESGVTRKMAECTEYLWRAEDKELNNLYKSLRHKVGRGSMAEKHLMDAQKAWIAFRDATCAFESEGHSDGTMKPVFSMSCLQTQTKKRNSELKVYLNCTSNGCP